MTTFLLYTIKLLFAIWVVFYAFIMAIGALAGAGSTDFNGNLNTLTDHVMNTSIFVFSGLQVALLGYLARKPKVWPVIIIVISATLPWLWSAIVFHDPGGLLVPGAYTLGIGLLCMAYLWLVFAPAKIQAKPLEKTPKTSDKKLRPEKPKKQGAKKKSTL